MTWTFSSVFVAILLILVFCYDYVSNGLLHSRRFGKSSRVDVYNSSKPTTSRYGLPI